MKLRIQAQHLQLGDIVGSGETIHGVRCAGIDLPTAKAMIVLASAKGSRTVLWSKYTMINVERAEKPIYHISPTYEDSWTVYKDSRPLQTFDFKEDAERYLDMSEHPEKYANPKLDNLDGF